MFKEVYMFIGSIEIFILLILIGRYLYCEKLFHNSRTWYLFFGTFLFTEVAFGILDNSGVSKVVLPFFFFSIFIFITREKHKIRGLFLVVPIAGLMLSILIIPIFFLYLFSKSMNVIIETDTIWMGMFDIIFWISFILFLWKGKSWRKRLDEIINNRILSKWERNLINGTGLFLFIFSILVLSVDELKIASLYAKCFVGFGILIVIFLEASIIAMVIQGNGKTYFQQAAMINEHYLKTQLEHFKTYQETQRETRRVHHDMKNHIACLYNLIQEKKYEEAGKYITDLSAQVQQIDKELHSGNDIVDAILNEKYANAKKDHITIFIDGRFGCFPIAAIDLCTIFSNAIDNAVEALRNSSVSNKEIQIEFKQQNGMQFVRFQNPVEQSKSNHTFLTAKRDSINHGFGLGNIKMAVEKYKGQMDYHIETFRDQDFFILEIILFAQSTT